MVKKIINIIPVIFISLIVFFQEIPVENFQSPTDSSIKLIKDPKLPTDEFIKKICNEMFSSSNQYNKYKNTLANPTKFFSNVDYYIESVESRIFRYITREDYEWMKLQDKKENFIYTDDILLDKCIISLDSIKNLSYFYNSLFNNFWKIYPEQYGEEGFNTLSLPLFSKDEKYFIIFLEYRCGGLCGEDAILLYEKTNGKYKYKETLYSGIS